MSEPVWMALTAAGAAAGVLALRRSWRARGDGGGGWKALGWLALALTFAMAAATMGAMRGLFAAFAIVSAVAWVVVASGLEVREARKRNGNRSLAPEPIERPSNWWRGTLRWLLAGPIGMIAAMGIGIFYSTWTGGAPQTRLVVGGLLVPVVWGACMAWTLADNRILRATAVLTGVTLFGFGLSILKGFS